MAPSAGTELDRPRRWLDDCAPERPLTEAVPRAVLAVNRLDPAEVPWHRRPMQPWTARDGP